jgi:hypothetical protein
VPQGKNCEHTPEYTQQVIKAGNVFLNMRK